MKNTSVVGIGVALSLSAGLFACSGTTGDACTGPSGCVEADSGGGEARDGSQVETNDSAPVDGTTSVDATLDASTPDSSVDATESMPDGGPSGSDATSDVVEPIDVTPGTDAAVDAGDAAPPVTCTCGVTCASLASTNAAFVSANYGSSASSCGSTSAPCLTIAEGLAAAQSLGAPVVYVDEGTYAETVTLTAGITLRGGWVDLGPGWAQSCKSNPNTLAVIAPTSDNVTITASGVTATLDTLTVTSKPTARAGETLYGVFAVNGANLTMKAVAVTVAAGGAGAPGGTGTAPTGPTSACSVGCAAADGICTQVGDGGAATLPGPTGAPGIPSYANTGYVAGNGATGGTGASGSDGPSGSTVESGLVDECGGTFTKYDSIPGAPGCGGPGGAPGTGGGGGGASIALFVWGSSVEISGGTLSAGEGAPGGTGGLGSTTSTWNYSAGGPGLPRPYDTCAGGITVPGHGTTPCTCTDGGATPAGGPGGAGGEGSAGGNGGCGSGGDSYGYYTGGGGTVTGTFPTPAAQFGGAGCALPDGGTSNGNSGPHN